MVATLKSAITLVKSRMLSVLMPSCPAASAIPAISLAAIGMLPDMSKISRRSPASCSVVASTVFLTPANALSKSIPARTEAVSPAAIAAPIAAALVLAILFNRESPSVKPVLSIFVSKSKDPSTRPAILAPPKIRLKTLPSCPLRAVPASAYPAAGKAAASFCKSFFALCF